MEVTNEFRVPTTADRTLRTIADLKRVAPCMPGAVLDAADGDTYHGRIKVRVGPIQITYRGTAKVVQVDRTAHRVVIAATGREVRGVGTASADVVATLREEGDETVVTVVTEIEVSGRPAQFGRGAMAEITGRIVEQFAERLRAMVAGTPERPGTEAMANAAGVGASEGSDAGPLPAASDSGGVAGRAPVGLSASEETEVLDLLSVAGATAAKRVVPVAVALTVVIGVMVWWRSVR